MTAAVSANAFSTAPANRHMTADEDLAYRPIPDDREDEFAAILRYAFSPERGPFDPDQYDGPPPPARPGEPRGLFAGDDLLTACKHHFFDARVRGTDLTLAGLSAVGTPPENRRRGLVRRLAGESLAEYRERGAPLTALWPFAHRFYARLGWALANRYAVVECPPETGSFARDAGVGGRWVQLDPDDWERLAPVLASNDGGHELAVDRTEQWWRDRVFHCWGADPFVYGWERDGELRAYLVYTVEEGEADGVGVGAGDERRLDVDELAAADHEARLACLGFLADHDSQVGRVRTYETPDASLLDLVGDPGDVEVEVHAGPQVRVVDVPGALEATAVRGDVHDDLVVGVEDPIAPWNDGAFRVEAEAGAVTVEPTDADPHAVVGIGPLSQLVVGYRTAGALAEVGELDGDPTAIEALGRLFPAGDPFLRERF